MFEKEKTIPIEKEKLLEEIRKMKDGGYRLVQIGCTPRDVFQMDYSFDRGGEFKNLRLMVPREEAKIPSITGIYWAAFTYENEIHDLFEIEFPGLALDYGGNFYRTAAKPPREDSGLTPREETEGKK